MWGEEEEGGGGEGEVRWLGMVCKVELIPSVVLYLKIACHVIL